MRQCPSLCGDERPLITHSISSGLCLQRQRDFYHKCHRCEYRGKAADFVVPEADLGTARPRLPELLIDAAEPAGEAVNEPVAANGVGRKVAAK